MFSISDCHASGVHCQKKQTSQLYNTIAFFPLLMMDAAPPPQKSSGYDVERTGLNLKKSQGLEYVLSSTWRFNIHKVLEIVVFLGLSKNSSPE